MNHWMPNESDAAFGKGSDFGCGSSELNRLSLSCFPAKPPASDRELTVVPIRIVVVVAASVMVCFLAVARTTAAATFERLIVEPSDIQLNATNQRQSVIVTGVTSDGGLIDLTRDADFSIDDDKIAQLAKNLISGKSNGTTVLHVSVAGAKSGINFQASVNVTVTDAESASPVHFVNDIIPLLSKLSCNSGGCHGKATGQNGFKLSVFGFDPLADYAALTRESRGRRVFTGDPDRSLLIMKAGGGGTHGGGRRTLPGSADYETLRNWIHQGMPWGDANAARVESIQVLPADRVIGRQAELQLLVTAIFSDGTKRDVTSAAAYTTNASNVADVDPVGLVSTGDVPGESAITVNYMGQVAAARILVPRPIESQQVFPELTENNAIDGFVWRKLKRMGILPSEVCDDSTFIRRVTIDTIGTLPTATEVREFLADGAADKREKLIDRILERDEFADYWSLKWADVLLVDRESLGERGAFEFHHWLRKQMSANRPYNEWVHELITASGNSGKFGPVNFYRAVRTPEDLTRSVSQAFLGIRMDCAQCHHHPFEKWAQEDFYGLAGFFKGIERKPLSEGRELVFHAGYQPTNMPLTNAAVTTRPPGGPAIDIEQPDPRVQLADWLTDKQNPYFARLAANRLWANYLGRGLVEPVDDLRSTNPATNEPLLAFLTEQVVSSKYGLKSVMRLIMRSRVYQLSSVTNESNARDEQNFSHFIPRRLAAEVLLDALCQVADVPEQFPGLPAGTRAIQVWDNRLPSYFLDTFGRSERKSACECGKSGDPTMSQALHLMNAPEIQQKLISEVGRVAKLSESNLSPQEILEQLCLTSIARMPTDKERAAVNKLFASGDRRQAIEDLTWALLNGYDFLFVH